MPKQKKPHVESSDGDGEDVQDNQNATNAQIASAIASNPALMAAVQSKLSGLVGKSSGYIESLPEPVKKRVNALKNLQVEFIGIEGKFCQDVHALEMKYAELFKPLYEKRRNIVNGEYEPNEEEGTWVEPGEDEEDEKKEEDKQEKEDDKNSKVNKGEGNKCEAEKLADELEKKATVDGEKEEQDKTDEKGIKEFWLTAMKNVETICEMIEVHDEPILSHLTDIKIILTGKRENSTEEINDDELGFALEFHFSPNDYFSNSVLTKSYKLQCEPDKDDPFSYEGTEIIGCAGCIIDWKKGKNVTQKTVKKKQKHKGRGQTRVVTKTVKNDSFFNFFDPPEVTEDEEMDEDLEGLLAADFEIGNFFRERLIPKAVLYFTGEAIDDDDDEFDDGDEDDNEELDEDEDEDPDYAPPADGEKPQECKQQ